MIGLGLVSPDMLVAAFVYFIAALMLHVFAGGGTGDFILLGGILGFGYLAKTILLPVGIVCIVSLAFFLWARRRDVAAAAVVFLLVAIPYASLCSAKKHRLTVGESARWNYLVFVNGADPFFPAGTHSRLIAVHPATYLYADTVGGTYPPWKDPSYWQDGITPKWNLSGVIERARFGILVYVVTLLNPFLGANLVLGFFVFAFLGATLPHRSESVFLLIPCAAALAAYLPLLVELRYVAPFLCTCWLLLYLTFQVRPRMPAKLAILFVTLTNLALSTNSSLRSFDTTEQSRSIVKAGETLQGCGLRPGDKISLISTESWMETAGQGSYVARLARVEIVSEIAEPQVFWAADAQMRSAALLRLKETGAKGVLLLGAPEGEERDWRHLDDSSYSYRPF
jgi:hypothetical protein